MVEELSSFIHRILTALGCVSVDIKDPAQDGITLKQWTSTYMRHLKRAPKLPTVEERYKHFNHCHDLHEKALVKAGAFLKGEVFSLLPATKSINRGVLRLDEEPLVDLTV